MLNINDYKRDGYAIVSNFLSAETCQVLMKRARELMEECWTDEFKTIFSTTDGQSHIKHRYFLDSGNQIRLFFEEAAFDAAGNLKCEKAFCINKMGHALHHLDDVFSTFSHSEKIQELARILEINEPQLLQSMYICKQPYIGGEVTCHQDATYLYVRNKPVTGLWFALEDATLENGCLWAIPGGHTTPLKSRMIRNERDEVRVDVYDHTPWPLDNMIPLEVPRGTLILLHGLLPHMSKENTSGKSRHAYALHLMAKEDEYASDNWLRR